MKILLSFAFLLAYPNLVFAHSSGLMHLHGFEFFIAMMIASLVMMNSKNLLKIRRVKND
tara:strand:- start:310 stop:486 length:177 start_codon:yes stop_codon:yes gene_type:complete